jgi:hypothetical protein
MKSLSFSRPAGRPGPDQAGARKAGEPAGRGLARTASRRPDQAEARTGPAGLLRPLKKTRKERKHRKSLKKRKIKERSGKAREKERMTEEFDNRVGGDSEGEEGHQEGEGRDPEGEGRDSEEEGRNSEAEGRVTATDGRDQRLDGSDEDRPARL